MTAFAPVANITFDPKQIAELQKILSPEELRKAQVWAIQATTRTTRKEMAWRVQEVLNLKSARAKQAIKTKVDRRSIEGTISVSYKPAPASYFSGTRATKRRGVTVQFRKDKGQLKFAGAFKANMRAGTEGAFHTGIFVRAPVGRSTTGKEAKAGHGVKRVWRLPVDEVFGPSVYGLFGENATSDFAKRELEHIGTLLQKNLASKVQHVLELRQRPDSPAP